MVGSLFLVISVLTVRFCSIVYTSYFILSQVLLCMQDSCFVLFFNFPPFQCRKGAIGYGHGYCFVIPRPHF